MRKEKGAIIVEATIALTTFVFLIMTILSIVNICFIQSKMAVALNTAAKEISQYSYLYYVTGLNKADASASAGTGESKKLAENTIDGVGTFMSSISSGAQAAEAGDFSTLIESVKNGAGSVDSLVKQYGDAIGDDPRGFIIGMGKMALSESKEFLKSQVLAKVLAKGFMKKNLMDSPGADPDAFLRHCNVENGMDGLDFTYTTLMAGGRSRNIQLVVTYDVRLLRLLNIDKTFRIRQCSKTTAWGNGISLMNPANNEPSAELEENGKSIWDSKNVVDRGKKIVENEKQKYTYTDSGSHFDAYDNRGGKNEFVTICSTNTHDKSYQTAEGIKGKLSASYNDLYNDASKLGEEVSVTDKSGTETTVSSDPATRSYRVVMVVPDDADMTMISQAVRDFQKDHPGAQVSIRTGYGSPSVEKPKAP